MGVLPPDSISSYTIIDTTSSSLFSDSL